MVARSTVRGDRGEHRVRRRRAGPRAGSIPPDLRGRGPGPGRGLLSLLDAAPDDAASTVTSARRELADRGRPTMSTAVGRLVADRLTLDATRSVDPHLRLRLPGAHDADHRRLVRHQARDGFDRVNPSHWYVASYLTVVIAAMGLIMLPVHLASYRERGVLRRFAVAGFPRWSFALSQVVIGSGHDRAASAILLAVAAPVYGVPAPHDGRGSLPAARDVGLRSIGVLLGTVLPSARSAQAVGLLLFFPSFLLGAGGPPPHVMGPALRSRRRVPAPDLADQRRSRTLARPRHRHRLARPGGRGRRHRGPGLAPVHLVTHLLPMTRCRPTSPTAPP